MHGKRLGTPRSRWRGAGSVAAVLFIVTQFTVACGGRPAGPGVASLGTTSASPASSSSGRAGALAYSECMRAHGIKDFPDPDSNGGISLSAGPGSDLDPNSSRFQAADNACKSLMPPAQHPNTQQLKAANLNYAKCMRAHGISDFPDPRADGTLQVQASPGSDLDPNNPQFKKADNACKHFELNGGKGGGSVSSNGKGGGS